MAPESSVLRFFIHVLHDLPGITHGWACMQVTETTFRRFLVDSPLVPSSGAGGVRYGSFHQQYWVDGQSLPAVMRFPAAPCHIPPASQAQPRPL